MNNNSKNNNTSNNNNNIDLWIGQTDANNNTMNNNWNDDGNDKDTTADWSWLIQLGSSDVSL